MKQIFLEPIQTKEEVDAKQGLFYSDEDFRYHFDSQCEVYGWDEGQWKLLAILLKQPNLSPPDESTCKTLRRWAKGGSNNRGYAGGFIDPARISKNVTDVTNRNAVKSKVIFSDGTISNYIRGNTVNSSIMGYSDVAPYQGGQKLDRPCRTTAFTRKHPEVWNEIQTLTKEIASFYRFHTPLAYEKQRIEASQVPDFQIGRTPFSTVTLNYNWQTACHVDKGDFQQGYTLIYATGKGWTGYGLGYPRFDFALYMEPGDVILQDAHEHHANTPGQGDRISIVFYLRDGMKHCH